MKSKPAPRPYCQSQSPSTRPDGWINFLFVISYSFVFVWLLWLQFVSFLCWFVCIDTGMAQSRSSSRCSSVASYGQRPPSLSDPPPTTLLGMDPNDGRGDEIQPCPIGFHPMAHTPPPTYVSRDQLREEQRQMLPPPSSHKPVKERRLPSRSGSTASLFSPFASLTRRLGAKHKSSKGVATGSSSTATTTSTPSRMSTPVEFPSDQQRHHHHHQQGPLMSRSVTPASSSVYSTFPRIHSSSSSTGTPSPSGRTPFISQLLANSNPAASSSSSSAPAPSCPSCPSPGPSYSSSSRLSSTGYPPMMMTEVLDEPVEEEVPICFYYFPSRNKERGGGEGRNDLTNLFGDWDVSHVSLSSIHRRRAFLKIPPPPRHLHNRCNKRQVLLTDDY